MQQTHLTAWQSHAPWPKRSQAWLLAELETWLAPRLPGLRSRDDLQTIPLEEALWGDCPWSLRPQLERLLPAGLTVPSGRRVQLRSPRSRKVYISLPTTSVASPIPRANSSVTSSSGVRISVMALRRK